MLRHTFHERRSGSEKRSRARVRQTLVLLACLASATYFAYHARYGRHGLEARAQLQERLALLEFELKSLETVRFKLQRDVALLSPEVPNADLVDEIARDVLGYVRPGESVVPLR